MQPAAIASTSLGDTSSGPQHQHRGPIYRKVLDKRKGAIRGLWDPASRAQRRPDVSEALRLKWAEAGA